MAKLTYACVLTRDLPGLATFYSRLLQAEPSWTGPYAEFPTEGGIFCLWGVEAYQEVAGSGAQPTGAGSVMLEFEVPDVDAEFERLRQTADVVLPPTTMPWGNRSIYLRDPDGNLVNLFTPVSPAR
jgi:uncharacterized glyoxalase superfamily protein PhnB